MKSWAAVIGALVIGLWLSTLVHAQDLRYLGPVPGTLSGRIELGAGQAQDVAVGSEIPGWGQVTTIAETHLVVRQRVSEAEQERLRSQGMATYDVLELHIPRADLGPQPVPPLR